MAKITIHVTPVDAEELARVTAALAPFVAARPELEAPEPAPAKRRTRAARKPKAEEPKAGEPKAGEPKAGEPKAEEPKAEEPKAVPSTKPSRSTEQTSSGRLGSREALLDAMRSAMKAGKRAAVVQVLAEFGATRATELKDEDVAAATAMVVAL